MECRYCGKECYGEFCCLGHRLYYNSHRGSWSEGSCPNVNKNIYRIATLVLCILFSLVSMHMLLSWRFDLVLTVDAVIISHSETVSISILDVVNYAHGHELVAYSLLNVFVLFSILSLLSPRFALVPPFVFLLAGYFISEGYSGEIYHILEYDLDVSGVMEYAVICFVIEIAMALLANATVQMYRGKKLHPDLLFNIFPDGISADRGVRLR